jgi:hypothetical protein
MMMYLTIFGIAVLIYFGVMILHALEGIEANTRRK